MIKKSIADRGRHIERMFEDAFKKLGLMPSVRETNFPPSEEGSGEYRLDIEIGAVKIYYALNGDSYLETLSVKGLSGMPGDNFYYADYFRSRGLLDQNIIQESIRVAIRAYFYWLKCDLKDN